MKYLYTFKAVQEELKKRGLPSSRTHLNILEREGIMLQPEYLIKFHRENKGFSLTDMRAFSESEIEQIVTAIAKHQNNENITTK